MRNAIQKMDSLRQTASASSRCLHSAAFVALVISVLLAQFIGISLNPLDWPVLAGLVVLFLGVPHGGFDVALAKRRWQLSSSIRLGVFLGTYVAIGAVIAALWFALPSLALPLFLAMAAYHFGGDWEDALDHLPRVIVGAALICAPAILNRGEVVNIFSWITPSSIAETTAQLMALAGVPLLQAALVISLIIAVEKPLVALEITAILLLGLLTPALCFFLVYFCGFHSVRHVFGVANELQPSSAADLVSRSIPYAPIAVAGVLALTGALTILAIPVEFLGVVFVILAALTAPHMLLVDLKAVSHDKTDPAQ